MRLRRLALPLALGGALSGCLILQEDPYFEGQVTFRNRPLRILEERVEPADRVVRTGNGADCTLTFSIQADDPDVGDTLFVEWYVDYDPDLRPAPFRRPALPPGTSTVRRAEQRFDFSAQPPNLLATPGEHLVEVVVYDSAPREDRTAAPREVRSLPDGGTLVNPGFTVSHAWFVTVESEDCPPPEVTP
jgi:hypothetical protein